MTLAELIFNVKNIGLINRFIHKNRFLIRFFFEYKYKKIDPYLTTTDLGEIGKLKIVFNVIKDRYYKHILDIGCGEGYLIERLLPIAEKITALDISRAALKRARNRIGNRNIRFIRKNILEYETDERFDLIICSEILFYLQIEDITTLAHKLTSWLLPGGYLLLVHIYGKDEHEKGIPLKSMGAKAIHPIFINTPGLYIAKHEEHPFFALTLLGKL